MLNKRISLVEKTSFIELANSSVKENKENIQLLRNCEKLFKTPEKKQSSIENSTTTVTLTNYFQQCKYSFQRTNAKGESKGLERKLNFEDELISNLKLGITEIKKNRYLSSTPTKKASPISITFSNLKQKNNKLKSKRFNSSSSKKDYSSLQKLEASLSKDSYLQISDDSMYFDELFDNKSDNYSESSNDTIESNLCCHYIIPFNKINDEKFKINAIKKIRKAGIPDSKSVHCKFYEYKRRPYDYGNILVNLDGNMTKFSEKYEVKRRKVNSNQKLFQGVQELIDCETKKNVDFGLYIDKDVGFTSEWQRKLKPTEMDDDVKTDDDQLEMAKKHVIKQLNEGWKEYKRKRELIEIGC